MSEYIQPWKFELDRYPKHFLDDLGDFCGALLSTLNGLEIAMRQFHPPNLLKIQTALLPFGQRLKAVRGVFEQSVSAMGAAVEFRELTDLSHTYPREENNLILNWFDPTLSLCKNGNTYR